MLPRRVDSSGETCKGLSAADEGAPWDEGSHPDAQQLQSEWRERMFAHLAALEHPIPLQDLPRRCPRPPGLATRLGKVLANDPADRFTVIGRVSPPPHTPLPPSESGGLGVRRAARVTPYRRPRLGQVAARYARQRRARASASRWPRRACARRRARGRRGLSTYKGARVGARRDAAGALELAGGAVRRPRVARVAWSREVPPPALLSTEGVYSRDMGRGNSREGGGVPPPAPIPRRRSNSSSRWRPGAPPPPPPPPLVLSGHAASLTPYQPGTSRPSPRTNRRPGAQPRGARAAAAHAAGAERALPPDHDPVARPVRSPTLGHSVGARVGEGGRRGVGARPHLGGLDRSP